MKILALYQSETLSLMRRVKAPFSTLAQRGHTFTFLQTHTFSAGLSYSADVTVLQNWRLTEEEVRDMQQCASQGRLFVVDCSDPVLLDDPLYRAQMHSAHLVTVPNSYLKREAEIIVHSAKVAITPSCLDMPYFMNVDRMPLHKTRIGCLGPFNWTLVVKPLELLVKKHQDIEIVTGPEAAQIFGKETTFPYWEISYRLSDYRRILYLISFGLCPLDGEHGYDMIGVQELGIYCRPTIQITPPDLAAKVDPWMKAMEKWIMHPKERATRGMVAYQEANRHRATVEADTYLDVYRKKLPHLTTI